MSTSGVNQTVVPVGGINAVAFAELCAGSPKPSDIGPEIRKLGLEIYDLPSVTSEICGAAYRNYVLARRNSNEADCVWEPVTAGP